MRGLHKDYAQRRARQSGDAGGNGGVHARDVVNADGAGMPVAVHGRTGPGGLLWSAGGDGAALYSASARRGASGDGNALPLNPPCLSQALGSCEALWPHRGGCPLCRHGRGNGVEPVVAVDPGPTRVVARSPALPTSAEAPSRQASRCHAPGIRRGTVNVTPDDKQPRLPGPARRSERKPQRLNGFRNAARTRPVEGLTAPLPCGRLSRSAQPGGRCPTGPACRHVDPDGTNGDRSDLPGGFRGWEAFGRHSPLTRRAWHPVGQQRVLVEDRDG